MLLTVAILDPTAPQTLQQLGLDGCLDAGTPVSFPILAPGDNLVCQVEAPGESSRFLCTDLIAMKVVHDSYRSLNGVTLTWLVVANQHLNRTPAPQLGA